MNINSQVISNNVKCLEKTEAKNSNNLKQDQQTAISEIEEFLKNEEQQVFVLQGTTNSGKSYLIPFIMENAHRLGIQESKLFATSVRVANNLLSLNELDEVNSIYSYIYGGQKTEVVEQDEEIESEEDREDFQIEVVPLKKSENTNNALFIVDDSQLVSDSFHYSIDLIFGSGYLLKDFLTFADIKKTKRKIIFIGDPYQLQLGSTNENSLNTEYLESVYKLKTKEYELLDKADYSDINMQILKCVEAIRNKYYNSLKFVQCEQLQLPNKEEALKAVKNLISSKSGHILCFSNEESQSINLWIKEHILKNGMHIAPGDTVIFNNNISIEDEDNPFGETKKIFNGQFAIVVEVSNIVYLKETKMIKDNLTTLTFREITLRLNENGQQVKVICMENYLVDSRSELSQNELCLFKLLLDTELSAARKNNPFIQSNEYLKLCNDSKYIKFSAENNEFISKLLIGRSRRKDLNEEELYFKNLIGDAKRSYRKRVESSLKLDTSSKYNKLKNAAFLRFGWAMTVHKAMSYKWDEVIFNINQGESSGKANQQYFKWLYTGVSRAKQKVFLLNYKPITAFDKAEMIDTNAETRQENLIFISYNSEKEKRLEELKQYIVSKIVYSSIVIEKIERFNWQERYSFTNEKNNKAILSISYNGNGEFKSPVLMGGDSTLGNIIIEILRNKSHIFDFSIIKDDWRKREYEGLSAILKENNIYFEQIIQKNYKDKIKFYDGENQLDVEIDYNGAGAFSRISAKYYSTMDMWEKLKKIISDLKDGK